MGYFFMFDHIKEEIRELVESNPKGYNAIIRFKYPELCQYLKETYPSRGEGLYQWLYSVQPPLCLQCKHAVCAFNSIHNGGYRQFCSSSCRAKYHKSHKNAHAPDGTLKLSAKVKLSAGSASSRAKAQQTYLEKHGTNMYDDISKKRSEHYNAKVPDVLRDFDFCKQVKIPLTELAADLNVPYFMVLKHFRAHGLSTQNTIAPHVSATESHICEYLDELGVDYVRSVRNILSNRREIDIFIPSLNVGIEYCGLYWHSDRNGYSPTKHQEKFIDAQARGIKLITVFEDEWMHKREIVKSRLRSLTHNNQRIFARKCSISVADYDTVTSLLNQWHIQGSRNAGTNYCLSYNNEIVAILTYGKPRYGSEDMEIIRYATRPGYTVVGGFSKLLTHLKTNHSVSTIVSYSDNRWGNGEVYNKAGMINCGITDPSYYYFLPAERKRYHRSAFMKHRIVAEMGGDPNLTEIENMKNFGYNRIFDCGTTKWILRC